MSNKRVDRLEVGVEAPKSPNDEVVWIDADSNTISRYDEGTNEWISVGGSEAGTFDDPILKDNVRFTDSNDSVRLKVEHGGTGVVRLHAPEDDLALRSANDILLYAGDDGPGNVYIGWGDTTYTPDSTNRVATIGDIQSASSGSITFDGVEIRGAGTASGDGLGAGTMELVPDVDLYSNDQYLIIDPTDPNHIHIRAGGAIDESIAKVILGGERNHVYVSDSDREVSIRTRPVMIENTYENLNLTNSITFVTSNSSDINIDYVVTIGEGVHVVDSVTSNSPVEGQMSVTATGASFTAGSSYVFTYEPTYENFWEFGSNGYLSGPAMGGLFVSGILNGEGDLWLNSSDKVVLSSGSGVFLEDQDIPNNQIATLGDLPTGATGSFDTATHTVTVTNGIITDITAL